MSFVATSNQIRGHGQEFGVDLGSIQLGKALSSVVEISADGECPGVQELIK